MDFRKVLLACFLFVVILTPLTVESSPEITVQIDFEELAKYAGTHRIYEPEEYNDFITPNSEAIRAVAEQLRGETAEDGIRAVYRFVSKFEEKSYDDEAENLRYPVAVLAARDGDCSDQSILAASILRALGYDARLVLFDYNGDGSMEHMAVVVKLEGRNIFLDPIADKFGEIPKFPGEKIIL